jgi:hypothetical protein
MKQAKSVKYLLMFVFVICHIEIGSTYERGSLDTLVEHKAQLIVKKCVEKAKEIREERICESKKEAIKMCLHDEVKTKDIDKAQKSCEHLYIL